MKNLKKFKYSFSNFIKLYLIGICWDYYSTPSSIKRLIVVGVKTLPAKLFKELFKSWIFKQCIFF